MKLTIYGSGCAKCNRLTENAEAAARTLGISYDLDKVTDINGIIDAGVMNTPALAVDGRIVVAGKVPSADKIEKLLT